MKRKHSEDLIPDESESITLSLLSMSGRRKTMELPRSAIVRSIKMKMAEEGLGTRFTLQLINGELILSDDTELLSLTQPITLTHVKLPWVEDDASLITAVMNGSAQEVEKLLAAPVNPNCIRNGEPVICVAAKGGQSDVIQLLIEANTDTNAGNASDCFPSALIIACEGHPDFRAEKYDKDVITMLLDARAEVNGRPRGVSKEEPFRSALFIACRDYEPEIVKLLLARRADVNTPDDYGDTPLHVAAGAGCSSAVAELLNFRADVNVRDRDGRTPREFQMHPSLMSKVNISDFQLMRELLGPKASMEGDESSSDSEEIDSLIEAELVAFRQR